MATTTSANIQALLARPQQFIKASAPVTAANASPFSFIPRQLRKQPVVRANVVSGLQSRNVFDQFVRATSTDSTHQPASSVSSQQKSDGSSDGTTAGSSGESSRNSTPPTPYSPVDPELVLKEPSLHTTAPQRSGTPSSTDTKANATPPTSPNKRRASVELTATRSPQRIKGPEGLRLDKQMDAEPRKSGKLDELADTSMDSDDADTPGKIRIPLGKAVRLVRPRLHGPLPYDVIMANGGGFDGSSDDQDMPDSPSSPVEEPKKLSTKEKALPKPESTSPTSPPAKRKLDDENGKPTSQRRKSNDGSATPSPSKTADSSASSEKASAQWRAWREDRKNLRARGFHNPHSLCYRNSALQFILSNDHLFWLLRGHEDACKVKGDCPACQIVKLHHHHFGEAKKRMNNNPYTSRFVDAVKKQLPKLFKGAQQQDSAEYMRELLDKVEEALKKGKPKDQANKQAIRQSLGGDLRSTITCSRCKYVSSSPQDHLDLLITPGDWIKASNKAPFCIEEALERHFSPEEVEWTCDKCKKTSECKKQLRYVRPPKFLTVPIARHTTRIRHGMPVFGKLGNQVKYGLDLKIPAGEGKQKYIYHYKLASVVGHLGSLGGGHYVAFAKQPDDSWALCDDDDVRPCTSKTVMSCDDNSYQAAILGYSLLRREPVKQPGDSSKL